MFPIFTELKGSRTFIGAGLIFLIGMFAMIGDVDLTPVVKLFVKDENQVPLAMCVLAIVFVWLRAISNTTPGGMNSAMQSAPTYRGVDDGD